MLISNKEVKDIYSDQYDQLTQELIDELNNDLTDDEKEKKIKKINNDIINKLRIKYTVLRFDKVPNCQYLRELMRENMVGYEFDY